MSANKENKIQLVEELATSLKDAKSIIFVDFRGLSVSEDTAMRKAFRSANVNYKVCKNTLFKLALNKIGVKDYDEKMFEGTTAAVYSDDEVNPAKLFCKSMKDLNKMDVKFGIVNGKILSKAEVEALSKIPAKDQLLAILVGTLQGPISAFARALNKVAEQKQN